MPQKKKKILFIITQSEFGGAQRFLLGLVMRLDPAVFDVVVASQPGELLDTLNARSVATRSLRWLRRNISLVRDTLAAREIYGLLNREKPDTLFLLSSKAGFLGSLAAALVVPSPCVVYRIGGWAFNDPQSWVLRKLYLWAEKISTRWKDVIITNSQHDTDQARRLGIVPRKKLVTIYNGIEVASLDFLSRKEALTDLFVPSGAMLVGCIANFYKTKGLPYLIEAAAALHKKNPHMRFAIIGDGRERKRIEACIAECDAGKYVFLAGHLPGAWRYIQAFDVFALPSLKEGFPWVVLEAMAAEVPIVATQVGALPEIIESGKNGLLVEPGNAKQIAKAIETLVENKILCDSLAAEARKTVEQRFTLDKMLGDIRDLL